MPTDDANVPPTHLVLVQPTGIDLHVRSGETILDAAFRLGMRWPTSCYGQAQCTRCHVRVLAGAEHAGPVAVDEAPVLARLRLLTGEDGVRLACRLVVDGELTVEQQGVRPPT